MPRKPKSIPVDDFNVADEAAEREGSGYVWNRIDHHPFDVLSVILFVAAFAALAWALFVIG
jgi:predicted component of type VI protein secretion system